MIAVSLPRRRIAFTPGLKDVEKKELIIQMWVKNEWLGYYCMPILHTHMKLDRPQNYLLSDKIYF